MRSAITLTLTALGMAHVWHSSAIAEGNLTGIHRVRGQWSGNGFGGVTDHIKGSFLESFIDGTMSPSGTHNLNLLSGYYDGDNHWLRAISQTWVDGAGHAPDWGYHGASIRTSCSSQGTIMFGNTAPMTVLVGFGFVTAISRDQPDINGDYESTAITSIRVQLLTPSGQITDTPKTVTVSESHSDYRGRQGGFGYSRIVNNSQLGSGPSDSQTSILSLTVPPNHGIQVSLYAEAFSQANTWSIFSADRSANVYCTFLLSDNAKPIVSSDVSSAQPYRKSVFDAMLATPATAGPVLAFEPVNGHAAITAIVPPGTPPASVTLQSSTDLTNWTTIPNSGYVPPAYTNRFIQFSPPISINNPASRQFFRVVTQAP